MKYKIDKIDSLQNIAQLLLNTNDDNHVDISPTVDFENRASYQQGRVSKEEDLIKFQRILEEKEDTDGN